MNWIVRQYWGPKAHGLDEDLSGERRFEATDPEAAAEAFMERIETHGALSEWIENGNEIELLVRGEKDTVDHLVIVTVDWDPTFTAHSKGPRS